MSRIYASGVKATAIANIKADIAAFIRFDTDGRKVVDTAALQVYLQEQLLLISADAEFISPATADSSAAAAKAVNTAALANSLNDAIGPTRWKARPDWPTTTNVLSGSALVAAVKAGQAELKRISDSISTLYDDLDGKLKLAITDYYYDQGVDTDVPTGVVRLVEDRTVYHTHVSDRGEESAPSPAAELVELDQNDTVTYTASTPPSGRNITSIRWYRSASGNQGAAFLFVAEKTVAAGLSYTDSLKGAELGEPCPTTTWAEPPADLRGMVSGPNGAVAGFTGNRFCPSENFYPYAYPREYEQTTAWPIVGVGVFDQTYVVLTTGNPYFISGSDSASLSKREIQCQQACVSRRSIASGMGGVFFASPDGICVADYNGVRVITGATGFNLFDRKDWAAMGPASIAWACVHEGAYLFQCTAGTYSLDLASGKLTKIDTTGTAVYVDLLTDTVYVATGTTILALFASGTARTGVWKSKTVKMERWCNLGWLQVDSYFATSMTVKVWRDSVLTDTVAVTSRTPVRISAGRGLEIEVELSGAARTTSVTLASSSAELKVLA